jgi:hypothetical protein
MRGWGTSHRPHSVDSSLGGKPTTQSQGPPTERDGPRKEKEEQKWDTTTLAGRTGALWQEEGSHKAPEQPYIVSITQSLKGSTSQEVHENPVVFRNRCVRSIATPVGNTDDAESSRLVRKHNKS